MVRAAALGLLLLAGCSREADIYQPAPDYDAEIALLESRIADLEANQLQHDTDLRVAKANITQLFNQNAEAQDRLFKNDRTFWQEANRLRARDGIEPLEWQD